MPNYHGKEVAKQSEEFKKEVAERQRSEVAAAEKATYPDRISEPRCTVCQHPYRDFVEMQLVKGMTYTQIGEYVTPALERRAIANHYKKHMDLQDQALRAMLEREARAIGLDVEEGVQDLVTRRTVLETALRRGYEDLQNGVSSVEPRDLIQIAKLLGDWDQIQYQGTIDEMREQVHIVTLAIQEVCEPEVASAIGLKIRELQAKASASTTSQVADELQEGPVDAEVVDE